MNLNAQDPQLWDKVNSLCNDINERLYLVCITIETLVEYNKQRCEEIVLENKDLHIDQLSMMEKYINLVKDLNKLRNNIKNSNDLELLEDHILRISILVDFEHDLYDALVSLTFKLNSLVVQHLKNKK